MNEWTDGGLLKPQWILQPPVIKMSVNNAKSIHGGFRILLGVHTCQGGGSMYTQTAENCRISKKYNYTQETLNPKTRFH